MNSSQDRRRFAVALPPWPAAAQAAAPAAAAQRPELAVSGLSGPALVLALQWQLEQNHRTCLRRRKGTRSLDFSFQMAFQIDFRIDLFPTLMSTDVDLATSVTTV